jgi:lon-related putative ATP-dependent protease
MSSARRLSADELRRSCRQGELPFETTAEASKVQGMFGQARAVEALRFGTGVRRPGYNLFVMGPPGVGKQTLLRSYLGEHARARPTPSDWCYAHHFADPARPRAIELEAGMGERLVRDTRRAVGRLRDDLRAAFESDELRTRKQAIDARLEKLQDEALSAAQERARLRGVAVRRTPDGIGVAPMRQGEAMSPEEFQGLPKSERDVLQVKVDEVGAELQAVLHQFHGWERAHQQALEALGREIAGSVAREALAHLRSRYGHVRAVREHLEGIERDVVDRFDELLEGFTDGDATSPRLPGGLEREDTEPFARYELNLLVARRGDSGAPVVHEEHPNYANLVGRLEHEAQFGTLVTNFRLIEGGALHRAIGGYLILDALKVLQSPFAWEALKRALKTGEVRIEPPDQALGLPAVSSVKPQPIPLGGLKVVLTGDRFLYHQLAALDPEFAELFKVLVDFEEHIDRAATSEASFANLVATLVDKEDLRPFDRSAVARVIDHAVRLAGDVDKVSVHMRRIVDLLRETEYWAGEAGRDIATAADVEAALEAQRVRCGRIRERMQEAIRREDILVATEGARVGQVNGLSVSGFGAMSLGHPTRITARTRIGHGEVLDIEREVELGGPIHSKGVLILSGLLGSRYALGVPLSLSATLVFEQSYGPVEGDSASLAELCALLSALSEVPARQAIALTGSVNQQGDVQSVGGVNEKIEGFFDVCRDLGLTGEQGVILPRTNVKNLMLREEVVEAVQGGRFHVYAVATVDEAIELLMGSEAGSRDTSGSFPAGSVNARVERRLIEYAEAARAFGGARRR